MRTTGGHLITGLFVYNYNAVITNIVDGDTVDAEVALGFGISFEIRIRILGLDTPEIYHPSCEAERIHGKEATIRATELLLNKNVILHTLKDKTGKYGRYLADIIIDGKHYADLMQDFQKKDNYNQVGE